MRTNLQRVSSRLVRGWTLGFAFSAALAASVPAVHGQSRAWVAEDLGVVTTPVGGLNNQSGTALEIVLTREDEVVVHGFRSGCRAETSLLVSSSAFGVAIMGGVNHVVTSDGRRTTMGADPCWFLDNETPMELLPMPTGFFTSGHPKAMNAGSTVVGFGTSFIGGSGTRDLPVRWAATAGFTASVLQTGIDSLGFPKTGVALAISDAGTVVGFTGSGNDKRAVKFREGQDPVILSASYLQGILTEATGITNNGMFTGNGRFLMEIGGSAVMQNRGWVANTGVARTLLPDTYLVPGKPWRLYTQSVAHKINSAGLAVGYIVSSQIPKTAALWDLSGNLYDLLQNTDNLDGIVLSEAVAINDFGIILAFGKRPDEITLRAVILRPTGNRLIPYSGGTY